MTDERSSESPRAGGFTELLGLEFLKIEKDEVIGAWDAAPHHHQPMGIVHGGVYASVVETLCSMGAYASVMDRGLAVVGLDNSTSFLRAVRSGRLRGVARPVQSGRRTQLWECEIRDAQDRLIATGRVRLLCVDADEFRNRD